MTVRKKIRIPILTGVLLATSVCQARAGVKPFREAYVCAGAVLNSPDGVNLKTHDVKFGFSLRVDLFESGGWDVFFGYTMQCMWNAFNTDSSPFYDNSYMPGFYAQKGPWIIGYEHCSNGRPYRYSVPMTDGHTLDGSRGMNYLYAQRDFKWGRSTLSLMAKAGVGAGIGEGRWLNKFTQDIYLHYMGYVTATYGCRFGDYAVYASVTPIYNRSIANVRIIVDRQLPRFRPFVMFNYGYEAMIDCAPGVKAPCSLRFGLAF